MKLKKVHFPILILTSVLVLYLQSCKKQSNIKQSEKISFSPNYLALAEKYLGDAKYDSAFYYYNKTKSASKIENQNNLIIYCLLKIAVIQQNAADYSASETTATEAISLFDDDTDLQYKRAIYNLLGVNYKNLYDYDNAIHYYNLAYNITSDEVNQSIIKNNMAVVYMDKDSFERALQILLPLETKNLTDNPENNARVLDNIGYCYYKLKNTRAFNYLSQALEIRKKINNCFGITSSYMHFSELYSETNQKLAQQYAKDAYKKATEINNTDDRLISLKLLIKNSNGEKLKKITLLYLKINDSIIKARQKAKNQFAKIKYDSKKDREENLKLKAQKAENALQLEKVKNRNLTLYIIISLVLGSIFFLYYYLTTKGKREKTAAIYESETRISKKLHDELANEVYHTIVLAETKDLSSSENKEILLSNLDTIYSGTRNISRQNSTIDTGENFESELKEMLSSYNGNEVRVIIKDNNDINWPKIQSEKKIAVYRVLQELLVNMKKHSQCSFVVIGFEENDKQVQIQYSDNGIGFSGKMNLRNGLKNAENRIHNIKGTLTFESEPNKGLKVKITFPK